MTFKILKAFGAGGGSEAVSSSSITRLRKYVTELAALHEEITGKRWLNNARCPELPSTRVATALRSVTTTLPAATAAVLAAVVVWRNIEAITDQPFLFFAPLLALAALILQRLVFRGLSRLCCCLYRRN